MQLTHEQHAALTAEAAANLPAGVQKVFERDDHGFVLQLRGGGRTTFLLVDTTAWARVCTIDAKPRQPPAPSAYVMLLRKMLVGTGLTDLHLADDDRVVTMRFTRRTDDAVETITLVVELFAPNAFLLDGDDVVLATQHANARVPRGKHYAAPSTPPSLTQGDPLNLAAREVGTRSAALHATLAAEHHSDHTAALRNSLAATLRREQRKARRLISNLEADLQRAEHAQQFRRFGELLQAAYGQPLPRGATFATVPDYYAEGVPLVEVPLEPARSLKDNIARYFHEYRRMNAAIDNISTRLLNAMERLDTLDHARAELADAPHDTLEALEQRWLTERLYKPARQQQSKQKSQPQLPYRTFTAHSGATILVGRGAKHNDALTTRVARGRDIWLHARDWAGAHVVLRMDRDGDPHSADLRDAALLAAHFSKGRGDSLVDVTYTRAKWVRKPKGAPVGMVNVADGKTIAVAPDDARLTALFETEA